MRRLRSNGIVSRTLLWRSLELKLRKHTSAWIGSMVDILRASTHFVERLYLLSCSNFNLLKGKEVNAIKREEGWKQQRGSSKVCRWWRWRSNRACDYACVGQSPVQSSNLPRAKFHLFLFEVVCVPAIHEGGRFLISRICSSVTEWTKSVRDFWCTGLVCVTEIYKLWRDTGLEWIG